MELFKKEMIKYILDTDESDIERVLSKLTTEYYKEETVDAQNVIDHIEEEQDERN